MGKTILSIDDSASMRQMVRFTLNSAGYDVIEAIDGLDGLAKARSSPINVVLTDLNMPRMDGITLIRELRELPEVKWVPIIFLTTESSNDRKAEAKAAGATAWIVKPFQQEQLLTVVKRVIG